MPSKSPAQARLMAAAAHTPGGYGDVPQSVGREFNKADARSGYLSRAEHDLHRRGPSHRGKTSMTGRRHGARPRYS